MAGIVTDDVVVNAGAGAAANAPVMMGEMKPVQKAMRKAAISSIATSAAGIIGDLPLKLSQKPHCKFLSVAFALAFFATFLSGIGLILLSIILPRVHVPLSSAKKAVWAVKKMVWVTVVLLLIPQILKNTLLLMAA